MKHPCMTLWPEKFFADTAGIPGDAANCYLALLCHAWVRDGSLPNDDKTLRMLARCEARRWSRIKPLIMAFWILAEDGRWHQKRLDEEWERANRKHRDRPAKKPTADYANRHTLIPNLHRDTPKKSNKINENRPSLARARNPTPTREVCPLGRDFPCETQSLSEPAAALSVGHAAQPAPDNPPIPSNGAGPMPPPEDMPPETADRIGNLFSNLVAELRAKNAPFEPPQSAQAAKGAASEELEQTAALKRLEELKAVQLPKLSEAAKEAAGVQPEPQPQRHEKKWTTG